MKFNFDKIVNRKNTNSFKWDYVDKIFNGHDLIPMWVADMDFEVAPCISQAIKERAEHNIYGYTVRPNSFYESVIKWLKKRHNWDIKKEWIAYTPGVVPGLCYSVLAFTQPGDKVIIQTPVYHPFYNAVENNGRRLVTNPLILKDNRYLIDFEDLEKKIDNRTKMLILCSPHNPVGRVWQYDELKKLGEICIKNNILIVSDEIHSDIIYSGHKHIPFASISEEFSNNSITFIAPSKSFNIAGLKTSIAIISNKNLYNRFIQTLDNLGIMLTNIFGIVAFEAAYSEGEEWLNELLKYLEENINFLEKYIKEKMPKIEFHKPEGTYLCWLNIKKLGLNKEETKKFLIDKAKVALDYGTTFGIEGEGYLRMNIACPRKILEKALNNLEQAYLELNNN